MLLYLDIDGVVLGRNEAGEVALIPNFKAILAYLKKNFDCRWLTTHGRYRTGDVINYLKPYLSGINPEELGFIKAVAWKTLKTEAIDFDMPFIWVDDQPLQFELNVLREKGLLDRWLRELSIDKIEAKRRRVLTA